MESNFLIENNNLYNYVGEENVVSIPSGVERICTAAFCGHRELQEIRFPNSLKVIGRFAFSECKSLKNIFVTSNIESIAYDAFDGCVSLENIKVEKGNPFFMSLDGVLYSADGKTLIKYPPGRNNPVYKVPYGVERIARNAFNRNRFLVQIEMPPTLESIGYKAFCYSERLRTIEIPPFVHEIGYCAFSNCPALVQIIVDPCNRTFCSDSGILYNSDKSILLQVPCGYPESVIVLPGTVFEILDRAVTACRKVRKILSESSVYSSIDGVLFSESRSELLAYPAGASQTAYIVPGSVRTIGGSSFQGAQYLHRVKLGENVEKISRHAFEGSAISWVDFPEALRHIGWSSFGSCPNLTHIELNKTQTEFINAMAFCNCINLEKVILPGSIKKIERWAFLFCDSLNSVEFSSNVQKQFFNGARFELDEKEKQVIMSS